MLLLLLLAAQAPSARAGDAPTPDASAPNVGPRGILVVVCESHDRVLAHWLRAASEGRIPRSGVTVVHFDAHPDLAVPDRAVPRGWPADPDELMASVNIASFQLAAVRIGLVDRITWLRPDFSNQLPDGPRTFRVGLAEGAVRVDDPSDYYVLDEGWAPRAALVDPVPADVRVLSLEQALRERSLADGPVIFDIDLDGFATLNPASERLRRAGLRDADVERIRTLFAPERLGLAADPTTRIAELTELTDAVAALSALELAELPGALVVLWKRGLGPGDLFVLYRILSRADDGSAFDVLLEDGRQVVGLPEHRAPLGEIERTARALAGLVQRGALRPALITIARSVEDGFTPAESWPQIESALMRALRDALGDFELRYDARVRPLQRATPGLRRASPH
ncbi:MAG: UPF0489 family protein [Deltaproteobacteria bacterium]|nr:MAG: UPF0489 family protein [Deltaproteobacteria bacterium]